MTEALIPVAVALCFNGTDLLTGIAGAFRNHNLKSAKMRDGLFKKLGFIFVYFLAFLIDFEGAKVGFTVGVELIPIVTLYACVTEAVSIIENIAKINPDFLPEKLLDLFHIKTELKGDD